MDRYTEALASAREDGDPELIALVLKNRAMDLEQLGESQRMLTDLTEARDSFRALGNAGEEGNSDYALGIALEHLGRRTSPGAHSSERCRCCPGRATCDSWPSP